MTGSKAVFDTWAWWEVLRGSPMGLRLKSRYLDSDGVRVFTSTISLGEVAAKLASEGRLEDVPVVISSLRGASEFVEVTGELAVAGGRLRARLRERQASASLADGIVLETARSLRATLVSQDRAFRGVADVIDH